MAELRTDPLTGDRVVVAPARAQRPGAWDAPEDRDESGRENCPFCEGHETETPPEIFAIADGRRQEPDTPGWRVRVAPNKFPAFGPQGAPSASGVFVAEAAVGEQDVVVHTPEHVATIAELSPAALEDIAAAWRWRATEGAPPGTAYLHAAVNEGREAGASLVHSHSQLFSLAFVPPRVSAELERQKRANECIACRVIAEEAAIGKRVAWAGAGIVAYCPHASRFPYETVVAPLACEADAFSSDLLSRALERAAEILRRLRAEAGWAPVNLWLTTSPRSAGSTHWRLTIAPRLTRPAGLELGAGLTINPVPPEDAAQLLRHS